MSLENNEWVAMPDDYQAEIIDPVIEFAELIVPDLEAA